MGSLVGGWRTKHSWCSLLQGTNHGSSCSLPAPHRCSCKASSYGRWPSRWMASLKCAKKTSLWTASFWNDLTSMTGPSTPVTVPLSPHPQELWEERKSTQSTVSPTRLLSILPFPALEASCVEELLSTRGTSSQLPTA